MLKRTFCHIPGIGNGKEIKLWNAGVTSWDHIISPDAPVNDIPNSLLNAIDQHVRDADSALKNHDIRYFASRIPPREMWRIFPAFRAQSVFLDIETTGTRTDSDSITTVALYDGKTTHCLVQNESLHTLPALLENYDVIITYNGKAFDIPIIQKQFGITLHHAHIDLCHVCHSLGIKGGLKKTEHILNIQRDGLVGLDGYAAVILWQMYQHTKDSRVLNTLLAYNCADTINLETLMVKLYNLKLQNIPHPPPHLDEPVMPSLPFAPDQNVVNSVLRRMGYNYY